ncbi:bone morphogenetic protein 7 [Galendromus occidentalis]|uniref:Bone morphogenetic protein 7 n=1 Tax=Galendromus occidentalis TaxID=34638 RepID=A0AAJ6QYJ6_9ACAR|nr:bone morphogenetic protein 7 [Galendromus occidentalis]
MSRFLRSTVLLVCAVLEVGQAGFYADNGLDQTISYRSLPKSEKREMENEILNLLGLDHRPKPKVHQTTNSAPQYLIDLYNQLDVEGDDRNTSLRGVDFVVSFVNHHDNKEDELSIEPKLRFDVSDISPHETVMRAELNLYRKDTRKTASSIEDQPGDEIVDETSPAEASSESSEPTSANVTATTAEVLHENVTDSEVTAKKNRAKRQANFDYLDDYPFYDQPFQLQVLSMRSGGIDSKDIVLESVANYTVKANETGWIRLNATDPLLNWVAFPGENFGLVVRLVDTESGLQLSPSQVGLVMAGAGELAPFMAAFVKEGAGAKSRSTRASEKTRREKPPMRSLNDDVPYFEIRHHFSRRNACQKRTLYVSFRDLGWQDWIIAPDGYSAFYCDGECSFPLNMNATNHAIVQTLVHLVSPGHAPKACCAPTKLTPIMVLYFDDNSNVILKKYKNMVVKSCGCH